jgi:hypothetical protein
MAQQTLINGNRYSFPSISVTLDGIPQPRGVFKSINYKATKDAAFVQGNRVVPEGRTRGYGTGGGSFEMLKSEWNDFVADATGNGAIPIMDVDFDILVGYSENGVDTTQDSLRGVRITDIDLNNQQGTDATYVNCTISIMRVKLNGIDTYADPAE